MNRGTLFLVVGPSGVCSEQSLPVAAQSIVPFGNVTALAILVAPV